MSRWFKLVAIAGVIMAGLWGSYTIWQYINRLPISGTSVFRPEFAARPSTQPGLNAIYVDLDVPGQTIGDAVFRLRRSSLGKTSSSYVWDWKAPSYPSDHFSFIDMRKLVQEEGAVTSWDVDVAKPGQLRLKVWRDMGEQWVVVSQSEIVTATAGLNHFTLDSSLPVEHGDYLGLYTDSGALKLISPLDLIPV